MKRTLEKTKRFFGNMPIQTKLIVIMIGLVFLSVASLTAYFYNTSSTPVSYTHLDVYKRQQPD